MPSRLFGVAAAVFSAGLVASLALADPPAVGKKYAFLVGVKDYDHINPLEFTENDVTELANVLRPAGYAVTLLTDSTGKADPKLAPTRANIDARLAELLDKCSRRDTVVVGLAGHGFQFPKAQPTDPDDAFFCPIDAKLSKARETMVSIRELYQKLDESGAGVKLLLVDACRNDPNRARGRGVDAATAPQPPQGVAALFSCSAGERSWEHGKLKHGVFFHYVLQGLKGEAKNGRGQVTWDRLQEYVKEQVIDNVAELAGEGVRQTPALRAGELAGKSPVLIAAAIAGGGEAVAPRPVPAPADDGKTFTSKTTRMKFVRIPKGTFMMGTPAGEKNPDHDATQHEVTLTKDFLLGVTEVTQGQWKAVMGSAPWSGQDYVKEGDDYPATYVNWDNAVEFSKALAGKDGRSYRLPTEAEWEYACRGGTTSSYHFGDAVGSLGDYAWFNKNGLEAGERYAHRVGQKMANPFGLRDMHGNVWEWCEDYYGPYAGLGRRDPLQSEKQSENTRVLRGGSYFNSDWHCRADWRSRSAPGNDSHFFGFRLVSRLD